MMTRLAHVCILARDLVETERFYCDVLGLPKAFAFEKEGECIGFYVRLGDDTFIEVFKGDPDNGAGGIRHFCIETEDLDALHARLTEHGLTPTEKILAIDHSWQFWFKDPNGYDIEVMQYTAESLQRRGGIARIE